MTSVIDRETRLHGARRLFGYAVSHDPLELYRDIEYPLPSRLSARATTYLAAQFSEARGKPIDPDAMSLLDSGILDTQNLLHRHLVDLVLSAGPEAARRFGGHESTVRTVALVALRSEEAMKNLISSHQHGRLSPVHVYSDGVALRSMPRSVSPESQGCPLANISASSEIHPDPLFQRFVVWTASLCVASIQRHIIDK